jgi:hypothetical protein
MAGSYPETVLADGAALYCRLGETSGTVARNECGSPHGTISGGVTLGVPAVIGDGNPAMQFGGVDGKISIPKGIYSDFGTDPLTLECWVRLTATPAVDQRLLSLAWGTTGAVQLYWSPPNGVGLFFRLGDNVNPAFSVRYQNAVPGNGRWTHVVAVLTRNPDTMLIYSNGVAQGSPTALPSAGRNYTATAATFYLAALNGTFQFFNGDLDEVAIYKVALTPAQILNHYKTGLMTIGQGGARIGGSATTARVRAAVATGGVRVAGTAASTRRRSHAATGGMLIAGTAQTRRAHHHAATGGVVVQGTARVRTFDEETAIDVSGVVTRQSAVVGPVAITRTVHGVVEVS